MTKNLAYGTIVVLLTVWAIWALQGAGRPAAPAASPAPATSPGSLVRVHAIFTPSPTAIPPGFPTPSPSEMAILASGDLDPKQPIFLFRSSPRARAVRVSAMLSDHVPGNWFSNMLDILQPVQEPSDQVGRMKIARDFLPTVTMLADGRALVAGGRDYRFKSVATARNYDPGSNAWSFTGSMNQARQFHTATLMRDGRVLVVGGQDDGTTVLASAEVYDPSSGAWSPVGSMSDARQGHSATLLEDGRVIVVGGLDGDEHALSSAEIYDPATGQWSAAGNLARPRFMHGARLLEHGSLLVEGGFARFYDTALGTTEIYDPSEGTWTATATQPP